MEVFEPGTIRNGVLVGLDSYLFLFSGNHKSFDYATGKLRADDESVENFWENFERRSSFLEEESITFLQIVVPSKEIVSRSKLPNPWSERIDGLFLRDYSRMRPSPSASKQLFYPLELLRGLEPNQQAFLTLDTHLSNIGIMTIVQSILKKWGLIYEVSDFFDYAKRPPRNCGDLGRMIKIKPANISEERLLPKTKNFIYCNQESLPGNSNYVSITHSPYSLTNQRLLIFGDSFIQQCIPSFAPVFRDIVFVRSSLFQADMVKLMAPNFVICATAERYLNRVINDTKSMPMMFALYGNSSYSPPSSFIESYSAQFAYKHHRSTYESWASSMQRQLQSLDELLGPGIIFKAKNWCKQVKVICASGQFMSSGQNPKLFFKLTSCFPDSQCIVELEMSTNVASTATLFFTTQEEPRFSEAKSIKLSVQPGVNHLKFILPRANLRPKLRIDPVSFRAAFSIKRIAAREVDE